MGENFLECIFNFFIKYFFSISRSDTKNEFAITLTPIRDVNPKK